MAVRHIDFLLPELSAGEALRLIAAVPGTLARGVGHERPAERRFEAEWTRVVGGDDAVAFPSGRSALSAILVAQGVGPGDEVVATGYTCEAVAQAITVTGATPVWADIDAARLSIDPQKLEDAITRRTRSVIIQHTLGLPADIDALLAVTSKHGLPTVEDACLAMGVRRGSGFLGAAADAAVFSFEVSKTISAGWGGLAQINRPGLAAEVRRARDSAGARGRTRAAQRLLQAGAYRFAYGPGPARFIGYPLAALAAIGVFGNSSSFTSPAGDGGEAARRFSAAQAGAHWAVLSGQLARLGRVVESSAAAAARYAGALVELGVADGRPVAAAERGFIRFPLLVKDPGAFSSYFAARGIATGRWFDYPISPRPGNPESVNYGPGQCPTGEAVGRHMVNLPTHSRLAAGDIKRITNCLYDFLASRGDELEFVTRYAAEPSAVPL